ncbi:hypothetical protein R9X47_10480 [Wukongibacter baidiensis]|uniref:hypothetical protein n=1 Tax=Wukongibacter baidiensis TaxID=1723361 RepID=UPI003D7FB2B0
MLNKKFSKLRIAIRALSFTIIILAIRNLIVKDYDIYGYGNLITNINQILMTVMFFLFGIDNYNQNRKSSYLYFAVSIVIGIMAFFTMFLP